MHARCVLLLAIARSGGILLYFLLSTYGYQWTYGFMSFVLNPNTTSLLYKHQCVTDKWTPRRPRS